jgi:hypothetical protein
MAGNEDESMRRMRPTRETAQMVELSWLTVSLTSTTRHEVAQMAHVY